MLVYRLQEPQTYVRTYEIGEVFEPRRTPGLWCDIRICKGFWGDEEKVKDFVDTMNTKDSVATRELNVTFGTSSHQRAQQHRRQLCCRNAESRRMGTRSQVAQARMVEGGTMNWAPIATAPKDITIMGFYGGIARPVRWSLWGGGVWRCAATTFMVLPG